MTDLPTLEHFRQMLIRQEGMRLQPYRCTSGKLTIGVGRNLEEVGISVDEALYLLNDDINRVIAEAQREFKWFDNLNAARQMVVLSMIFNMGLANFKEFKGTIADLARMDFDAASKEMLFSLWAVQVGHRAIDLSYIMKTGKLE